MSPNVLPEDMGNDVAVVHQDPLRISRAFDAACFGAGESEDAVNMIGDGTRLAIRVCRADDEIVGNGGQRRDLEDEDVGGLLIEHGLGDGEGRGSSCWYDRGPLGIDDDGVYKIPLKAATDLPRAALGEFLCECPMQRSGRAVVSGR